MLCRKFKQILFTKTTNSHVYHPLVPKRSFSKWSDVFGTKTNATSASRLKLLKDLVLSRILSSWTKSYLFSTVVRRYRKERGMREVIQYFQQVFFRSRRTHLLVAATATYKNNSTEERPGPPKKCSRNIKDKEMKKLIKDLETVNDLSKATLYCEGCAKRVIIDNKQSGVRYCTCPNTKPNQESYDGWVPYMEAKDVVIWRKEYKPGGLYAYKVYGRYQHIKAEDFAMIQVDGAYRKVWDTAVASLSVVEREANGVPDQFVLHWEVLWPRLFANRDYVYLRRHKEFDVQSQCLAYKAGIFEGSKPCETLQTSERPSVHSNAKRVSMEKDMMMREQNVGLTDNKVYVIVSRSCVHPNVPESKNAIRVNEYWSHMVITTLDGPDRPGMEFVLTYYDEPAVGGLPTAVTSWAMGRAGPAFLERMRIAATEYRGWLQTARKETPEFTPSGPEKVSFDVSEPEAVSEQDMESSKEGPDLEGPNIQEKATQTRPVIVTRVDMEQPKEANEVKEATGEKEPKEPVQEPLEGSKTQAPTPTEENENTNATQSISKENLELCEVSNKLAEEESSREDSSTEEKEEEETSRWWRYLYPSYYFV